MGSLNFIEPDWPLAGRVGALVTTRAGGVSPQPWASLNLGSNTKDDPQNVAQNRQILAAAMGLDINPFWLRQVHGSAVVKPRQVMGPAPEADASYTNQPGQALAVLTADCLPVLLGNEDASEIAVAHAGWRGLAAGVIAATLGQFRSSPGEIYAWLGPAISADHYQVGEDFRKVFEASPQFSALPVDQAFFPQPEGKWTADLYELARMQLRSLGVKAISGGDYCTYREADSFYSYRRDGETGRFATLIWLKK